MTTEYQNTERALRDRELALTTTQTFNFNLTMPRLPIETRNVLFDISRLVQKRNRSFATGVDRIDLAVGLNLLTEFGDRCSFVIAANGRITYLPLEYGEALLHYLDARWNNSKPAKVSLKLKARIFANLYLLLTSFGFSNPVVHDSTYVVASHSGVPKLRNGLRRLDPRGIMEHLLYIHDLIPIDTPEYQRPRSRAAFASYLSEATSQPCTIISNSIDTDRRVRKKAAKDGWKVKNFFVAMPELKGNPIPSPALRGAVQTYLDDPRPFFVVVGTIEPRKNHLLLLNIWRNFAESGIDIRLCIVGHRGWENENILDMLDRCEAIRPLVREFNDLGDHEVQALIRGSKALLFPSFIEGLGLPLVEAQTLGSSCIVSDIQVFHEIASPGTIFLDPLDGLGWTREILQLASVT